MQDRPSLEQKLTGTPSFRSLAMERELRQHCRSLGWAAAQSRYFLDPETRKWREIDVWAARQFVSEEHGGEIDLHLLIECKSLKEFSLLFSADEIFSSGVSPICLWAGHLLNANVLNAARKSLTSSTIGSQILECLQFAASPGGIDLVSFGDLTLPKADVHATAFRQMRPGSERSDDENQVIWNCIRSLWSACIENYTDFVREQIDKPAESLNATEVAGFSTSVKALMEAWRSSLRHIEIYHHVLIVEAPLFSWNGDVRGGWANSDSGISGVSA